MGRTSIPVSDNVHERIKNLKRGGESFDELLLKMADQYEPEVEENQAGAW